MITEVTVCVGYLIIRSMEHIATDATVCIPTACSTVNTKAPHIQWMLKLTYQQPAASCEPSHPSGSLIMWNNGPLNLSLGKANACT